MTVTPGQDARNLDGSAGTAGIEGLAGRRRWYIGTLTGETPQRVQGIGETGPVSGQAQRRDYPGSIGRRPAEGRDESIVVGGGNGSHGEGDGTTGRGCVCLPQWLLGRFVGECHLDNKIRGLIADPPPQVAALGAGLIGVETSVGREAPGQVGGAASGGLPITAGEGIGIGGGQGVEGHAGGAGG